MKRYKITAVIKYHRDVGEFEAEDGDGAMVLAQDSLRYQQISDRSPGGVYDLTFEEVHAQQHSDGQS